MQWHLPCHTRYGGTGRRRKSCGGIREVREIAAGIREFAAFGHKSERTSGRNTSRLIDRAQFAACGRIDGTPIDLTTQGPAPICQETISRSTAKEWDPLSGVDSVTVESCNTVPLILERRH
jgi:hypothetical protein